MFQKWEADPEVKIVMMKGAGGKAFCAGGDIVAVAQAAKTPGTTLSHDFFREEYVLSLPLLFTLTSSSLTFGLDFLLGTYRKPYVAIIDGITMGGALCHTLAAPSLIVTPLQVVLGCRCTGSFVWRLRRRGLRCQRRV